MATYPELIIALGSFVSVAVGAAVAWRKFSFERHRAIAAEKEMGLARAGLSFHALIPEWSNFLREARNLMEETAIDRFLLLRAWNGKLNPSWTTAFFQMRQQGGVPYSYQHLALDDTYVNYLKQMERKDGIYLDVSRMEPGLMRGIYELEGVSGSFWHFLDEEVDKEHRAITYCSFATSKPEGLNPNEQLRAKILANKLQALIHATNNREL